MVVPDSQSSEGGEEEGSETSESSDESVDSNRFVAGAGWPSEDKVSSSWGWKKDAGQQ